MERTLRGIAADHCFGCTAGAGASCQGALDEDMSVMG